MKDPTVGVRHCVIAENYFLHVICKFFRKFLELFIKFLVLGLPLVLNLSHPITHFPTTYLKETTGLYMFFTFLLFYYTTKWSVMVRPKVRKDNTASKKPPTENNSIL